MPRPPRLMLLAAALSAVPIVSSAQSVPRAALGRAEAQLPDPFDDVTAVRELSDGRVIVADRSAKTVTLADFRSGAATAIGREGQGPGEYAFPAGLVALPGDTTLLVDPGQRRFLVIGPDAKPKALLSFPGNMMGLLRVRGSDRQGRIYFQGSELGGPMEAGAPLPDSAPVLRWDRARDRIDTLGRIKVPALQRATSGSANARSVLVRMQPFSPQDDWTVAPDGRIGVVRVGDYHVEWWPPAGAKVNGPVVAYQKVAVSEKDKERSREATARAFRGLQVQIGGRRGGAASPRPPALGEPDWPAVKPPFRDGTSQVAPDGSLWVQRYGAADAPLVYDVFDASGRLARQVVMPKSARLVGFGARGMYVATKTDDDLETLARYPRP